MTLDADHLMDFAIPLSHQTVTAKDAIIYALSTGYSLNPLDPAHLEYMRETAPLTAATLANVVAHPGPWMKQAGVDWQRLVHSEHRLTIHRPVPLDIPLVSRSKMLSVVDRGVGKGMFASFERRIETESGASPVATIIQTNGCLGDGGCGSAGSPPKPLMSVPDRRADLTMTIRLREDAALLYRLNGDFNPLHHDPSYAADAGFSRPILHGLCTFGHAGYVIGKLCGNTAIAALDYIEARFSAPVMPGEEIVFELWRQDDSDIRFRATAPAREVIVLDRGTARLA